MCLGVPGRIIALYENSGLAMGKVDFGGVTKEVCLAYVPEAALGNYVVIHAGFAISLLDEEEAVGTLELLKQDGLLEGEIGPPGEAGN